jgi:CxxC-x17-CxxC domain-containing protein
MPRARKNFYRRASKRRPPPRSFKATCSRCGKELMMEVPPPEGKDLLCLDCYNKEAGVFFLGKREGDDPGRCPSSIFLFCR